MAFTGEQLARLADAALDYHIKNVVQKQTIQDKPLLKAFRSKLKNFSGGKEFVTKGIRGNFATGNLQGYDTDDTVTYREIANANRAKFKWYELHDGVKVTHTELKINGVSVTEGNETSEHDGAELTRLHDLLKDKWETWDEEYDRDWNNMLWLDGTTDPKKPPCLMSVIADDPRTGTIGGFDRATMVDLTGRPFWRNRARTGVVPLDSTWGIVGPALTGGSASSQTVVIFLQKEWRQLRRFGGAKNTLWLAGSDMIDQIEQELRSKGNYTLDGWMNKKATDAGMADIAFKGNAIQYDPTLDDMGRSKYLYIIDTDNIELRGMTGEVDKMHKPARPTDQYLLHRAKTWTGAFCAWQMNSSGVYAIT